MYGVANNNNLRFMITFFAYDVVTLSRVVCGIWLSCLVWNIVVLVHIKTQKCRSFSTSPQKKRFVRNHVIYILVYCKATPPPPRKKNKNTRTTAFLANLAKIDLCGVFIQPALATAQGRRPRKDASKKYAATHAQGLVTM